MGISVVIPIADGDDTWQGLIRDLSALNPNDEVIAAVASPNREVAEALKSLPCPSQIVSCPPGRARQLNAGAQKAASPCVWFLHCDSRISKSGIKALRSALSRDAQGFYFFDLRFLNDGPQFKGFMGFMGLLGFMEPMKLTELGTAFRSHILRLPFGDQGFAMSLETFKNLGGLSETAVYGEDHLLVWRAHQMGIKLQPIGMPLYTSARRYRDYGWRQTTVKHVKLTIKQALPQLLKLARGSKQRNSP